LSDSVRLLVTCGEAPEPQREKPRVTAGTLIQGAARIRAEVEGSTWPMPGDLKRAEDLEARAREQLPDRLSETGAGGELVPLTGERPVYRNTIERPDYVTAAASRDRTDLLQDAGALEVGLDVADTIAASNTLEIMLAHQQAVLHRSAMKIGKQLNRAMERLDGIIDPHAREQANIEANRLTGMMARLLATFQQGVLTIDRVRSGGGQTVTVRHLHQYVTVNEGGQAVVAGNVAPEGKSIPKTGGGRRK
jgi:hypothetical protein